MKVNIFFNTIFKYVTVLSVVLTLFLSVFHGSALAATPDPTKQLKPFLEKIVAELKSEDFKQEPMFRQCERIVVVASEHFDFREMSKRVMGKQWRTLTDEERDGFVKLFTDLLQYAYIGSLDEYVDREVIYKKQRIKGKRAEVKTLLVDDDKTIPVSYIMILRGDKWMVYDIVVEGVSLIRNYMEQIRSVLRDEKFSGLITMLEKKIKDLEAESETEE